MSDEIPTEVRALVQAAARGAAPMPATGAETVLRRGVRLRRRRAAATTAALAGLMAVVAAIPVWTARATPPQPPAASASASASVRPSASPRQLTGAPAQRLISIWSGLGFAYSGPAEHPTLTLENFREAAPADAMVVYPDFHEVDADGTRRWLRPAGSLITKPEEAVATPSGGHLLLGLGARRAGGSCGKLMELRLEQYSADGTRLVSRDVRRQCRTVALAGADERYAYLERGDVVVAHDLATGAEHDYVDLAPLKQGWTGAHSRVVVESGRVMVVTNSHQLGDPAAVIYDPVTGATHRLLRADDGGGLFSRVRLSPDGSRAAMITHKTGENGELGVTVYDVATNTVLTHQALATATGFGRAIEISAPGYHVAMAWHDDSALRVAWYPAQQDGKHLLSEVLRVSVVEVP